jgi:hypothetical protein
MGFSASVKAFTDAEPMTLLACFLMNDEAIEAEHLVVKSRTSGLTMTFTPRWQAPAGDDPGTVPVS